MLLWSSSLLPPFLPLLPRGSRCERKSSWNSKPATEACQPRVSTWMQPPDPAAEDLVITACIESHCSHMCLGTPGFIKEAEVSAQCCPASVSSACLDADTPWTSEGHRHGQGLCAQLFQWAGCGWESQVERQPSPLACSLGGTFATPIPLARILKAS